MKLRKMKYDGSTVCLAWIENPDARNEIEQSLKSFDKPAPSFVKALSAFVPHVLDLLELPSTYTDGLRVQSLSINYEDEGDGRCGLVITSLKSLKQANSPLVLNTPHLREDTDDDPPEATGRFLSGMGACLHDAIAEARAFVKDGKREQISLDDALREQDVTVEGNRVTFESGLSLAIGGTP